MQETCAWVWSRIESNYDWYSEQLKEKIARELDILSSGASNP